ncbi:N-acetyltransferase family protein [Enterococcus sp. LJL99]
MLVIREMMEEDRIALRELYYNSRKSTFDWQDPTTFKVEDFDRDTEDELILVAEEEGIICGFISLYLPDNFIHCLFIDADFKRRGIGQKLLMEAKQRLTLPMKLKCLSKNQQALEFYKKAGWQQVDEVTGEDPYWNLIYPKSVS